MAVTVHAPRADGNYHRQKRRADFTAKLLEELDVGLDELSEDTAVWAHGLLNPTPPRIEPAGPAPLRGLAGKVVEYVVGGFLDRHPELCHGISVEERNTDTATWWRPCERPRRLGVHVENVETGEVGRYEDTSCGSCDACRSNEAHRRAGQTLAAFDGLPLYRQLIDRKDRGAVLTRIRRRDTGGPDGHARYHVVPAPGGRLEVLSVVPSTLADEPAHLVPERGREAVVLDVWRAKPAGERSSASATTVTVKHGRKVPAGAWGREDTDTPWRLIGLDTAQVTPLEVGVLAEEQQLGWKYDGDMFTFAGRKAHPKVRELHRALGFISVDDLRRGGRAAPAVTVTGTADESALDAGRRLFAARRTLQRHRRGQLQLTA